MTTQHQDGGTVRELQFAKTNFAGWGIVLTEWTTYTGRVVHEIRRYSPRLNRTTRLELIETGETEARARANQWWLFEKNLGPHPQHTRIA